MSTADWAITCVTGCYLATVGAGLKVAHWYGPRLRLTAPLKEPAPPKGKPAAKDEPDDEQPLSILGGKSTGEAA